MTTAADSTTTPVRKSITVKADAPWKTMQEFIAAAKANPGKLRVASPGEGTISHLTLERWQIPGAFKTTHVPFSGWGETSPALLGGHVDAAMAQPGEVKPLVDAKKLEFVNGKAQVFQGLRRDNKGVERVKAGEVFPMADLRTMDWLVEGVVGQPR